MLLLAANATWLPHNYTVPWPEEATSDHVTGTTDPGARSSGVLRVAVLVVFGAVFVLSLLGNCTVLYVIGRHLGYRTVTNMFISALSTCDLLNTLVCMPMSFATIAARGWRLGPAGCVLNGFLFGCLEAISVAMVTFITLDRFIVVVRISPQAYSKRTACLVIVFTVCLAIGFSLPWYLVDTDRLRERWATEGVLATDLFYKVGFPHCMYAFHGATSLNGAVYSLVYIVVWYLLPCTCLGYAAACLIRVIRNSDNQIRPTTTHFNELRFSGEIRTSKTALYMDLFFLLCKGPYFVSGIVYFFSADVRPRPAVDTVLTLITWCTCAVNPVLYALRNPTVGRILRRRNDAWYIPNQPPPDVVLSSAGREQRSGATRIGHFQAASPTAPNGFESPLWRRGYRAGDRKHHAKSRYLVPDPAPVTCSCAQAPSTVSGSSTV